MNFQDYYKVLGVERQASQDMIQRAYWRLARQFHPDVNQSQRAEIRFRLINEAYEVLKDPSKRIRYDALENRYREGHADFGKANAGAEAGKGRFSDFFHNVFGGMEQQTASEQSAPRNDQAAASEEFELEITLAEAYFGATRIVESHDMVSRENGGLSRKPRKIEVKVPRGVTEGSRIKMPRQGGARFGQQNADLFLRIRLKPHSRFEVRGHDLHMVLDVTPWEAALGGDMEVEGIDGKIKARLPHGAQTDQTIRLRGKGLPRRGGGAGDLLARVRVVVPQDLSNEERQLFERLRQVSRFSPRA